RSAWIDAGVWHRDAQRGGEVSSSRGGEARVRKGQAHSAEPGDVLAVGGGVCGSGEAAGLLSGDTRHPGYDTSRVSASDDDSRAWPLNGDRPGGRGQRCQRVQERPAVCRLAGVGAAPAYHGREGALARHQQTRRYLSAQAPGAWSGGEDPLGGPQDGPTQPVAAAPARTPRQNPHRRGGGKQKCPDCLGALDEPPGLSTGHERRRTDTRISYSKGGVSKYFSSFLT